MTATETTTVPKDPAALAAEDIWRPKLIADTSISDGILPKLIDGGIETFGELDTETLEGDAPARLKKLKLDDEQIAEVLDLLDKAKAEALAEVNKPKEEPLPEPSMGKGGYELTTAISIGSVNNNADGKGISATCKVPIAGADGHVGLNLLRAIKTFRGAELDLELRQQDGQQSLEGMGLREFHAIGHIGNVTLTGDEKHLNFTLKFVRKAVDGNTLSAYAGKDAEIRCTNNAGPEDTSEQEDDQD